jgi:superfamily II DNA or RNA helicase
MVLEENLVIEPRDYQLECRDIVWETLTIRDIVLYVMAMGLGKTVTSAFIAKPWLENGKRGLFLCHETYILEHVEQEYRKVLLDNDIVYKTFYGGKDEQGNKRKDWSADQADMLFASFQSMNNWHEKWYLAFDRDHFDFMIVDESHHAQAPSYKEVIDYFQCKKIAMTATPDRMDLKDIRKIFGKEVFTMNLEEGIAKGHLANIEYHILSDGLDNRKLKQICRDVLEKGKRVSIKQLNETIFIKERDKAEKEIIAEYAKIKELAGDRKTLLFCERTKHADNLIPYFANGGVMHSGRTWKENDDVFKAFEKGDLQYVASVNKFNEGKHVPGVEVIVFLRATDSLTIFWQQLGRALAKNGTKVKVVVLDFVANLERLIMVRDMMLRIKLIEEEVLGKKLEKPPLDTHAINVSGEGFDFIFSDELVDIVKIIEALRKGYYDTCEEASQATIKLGIKSDSEYYRPLYRHREDLRLPSQPHKFYDDFPGWAIFFGHKDATKIPTGWKSFTGLRLKHVRKDFVEKFTLQFKESNPEWFDEYYCPGSGVMTFYHPELCKKIEAQFADREHAPEGWMTEHRVSRVCRTSKEKVAEFVKKYRNSKPKWFKNYLSKSAYLEHYGPVLVKKIQKQFPQQQELYQTYEEANIAAGKLGAETKGDYLELYKKDPRLPSNPKKIYSEFTTWPHFLALKGPSNDEIKKALSKRGVIDYWTLRLKGHEFSQLTFGDIGSGRVIAGIVLGTVTESVSHEDFERIAEKLGWNLTDDEKKEKYLTELALHGVTDYWTLQEMGMKFFKLKFTIVKKGAMAFINLVCKKSTDDRTIAGLDQLAESLNWIPTEEEKLQKYKEKLNEKGVIDYWTIKYEMGTQKFIKLDFGFLGKGVSISNIILGDERDEYVTGETLEKIAKKFGWIPSEEEKLQKYLSELKKHQITDYRSLMSISYKFADLDFGIFGQGKSFASMVLDVVSVSKIPVATELLKMLAKRLGWEEGRVEYIEALKKHGIVDHWTLISCYPINQKFEKVDFGIGNGRLIASGILGENIRHVTPAHLIQITEKLGWTPTEEEKISRYKHEFANHGITDYWTLRLSLGWKFRQLTFGPFRGGKNFVGIILGDHSKSEQASMVIVEQIAAKLGWTPTEEEKITKYKEALAQNSIIDRETLLKPRYRDFIAMDFGVLGKGTSFLAIALDKPIGEMRSKSLLDELANKLRLD